MNHDNRSSANTTRSGRVTTTRETQREATWLSEPNVSPCVDVAFITKSLLWANSEQLSHQTLLLVIPQAPDKYYLCASKSDDWTRCGTFCSWETEAGGFAGAARKAGG